MGMAKIGFLVMTVLINFGCATVSEVRNSPSIKSVTSDRSPYELANCVLHEANAHQMVYVTLTDIKGTFHLLFSTGFWPGQHPFAEVTFTAKEGGGTSVEMRAPLRTIWGGIQGENVWEYVMGCITQQERRPNSPS